LIYIYPPPGINAKVFNKNTKQPKKVVQIDRETQQRLAQAQPTTPKDAQDRSNRSKRKKANKKFLNKQTAEV
jgi:hypothetical protein